MINAAIKDCSASELYSGQNMGRAVCTADLASVIGAFSFVASGISYAVFHCPAWKRGTKPLCAGAIINIVSALAQVAAAGSDMTVSCALAAAPPAAPVAAPVEGAGEGHGRRL